MTPVSPVSDAVPWYVIYFSASIRCHVSHFPAGVSVVTPFSANILQCYVTSLFANVSVTVTTCHSLNISAVI